MPVLSIPLPDAVKTRLVKVIDSPLGLVTNISKTGRLETPGGCMEPVGEEVPIVIAITGGVGVDVAVRVDVTVPLGVDVEVGVLEAVVLGVIEWVDVADRVGVAVVESVGVGVPVEV
jgi:hypothetical protein